jgi:hypothetical protein
LSAGLVLNAVSTATLVIAVVFGAFQLWLLRKNRQDQQAIEMVRATQTTEWIGSVLVVQNLPDGITAEELDTRGQDVLNAVQALGIICETEGYMVFRRTIPLRVVDDLHGGIIRLAWQRLRPWIERDREASGNLNSFEWFQWLAERLEENHRPEKALGAHATHRDWRP